MKVIGHADVNCAELEYAILFPPAGKSCQDYLGPFIETAGGYLGNFTTAGVGDVCYYCPARTTDQFLAENFNMFSGHHWRDLGLVWVYVAFNVGASRCAVKYLNI